MNARIGRRFALCALLALLLAAPSAWARVGGGSSFSGSRSSGGGGGGDGGDLGGLIFWLLIRLFELHFYSPGLALIIDAVLVAVLLYVYYYRMASPPERTYAPGRNAGGGEAGEILSRVEIGERFAALRQYDPNFSEVLFQDFAYALYARVQDARGRNALAELRPYLQPKVLEQLNQLRGPDLKAVVGVIIGACTILRVSKPRSLMTIRVRFETNYTERRANGSEMTRYSVEVWDFARSRDVLSRPPDKVSANNCPNCGGGLELAPNGACQHCGVIVRGGEFDWAVSLVRVLQNEDRGPLLTANVPEVGTDLPTIRHPGLSAASQRLEALDPELKWAKVEQRVAHIFLNLQRAWSDRKWELARPYETDMLFQMHQYWIAEYRRQGLINVLKDPAITELVPVKITQDAFYDAITYRIYAQMIDYVTKEDGTAVSGDSRRPREFSEYWTFIRRRGVVAKPQGDDRNCPNCGAALKISMAGVCAYCNSKITSGEFDWVLSQIEQDESYRG